MFYESVIYDKAVMPRMQAKSAIFRNYKSRLGRLQRVRQTPIQYEIFLCYEVIHTHTSYIGIMYSYDTSYDIYLRIGTYVYATYNVWYIA